ncbi:MAG: hypothetical protein IJ514_06170 [Clostridia bacterium]|nr:hypothetical protein [Clostridia bacterium]
MRKIFKKTICSLLAVTTAAVALAGCNPYDDDEVEIDETKTQLYVYNYNGGYGSKWLDNVKNRFETQFAGYEGENGKVGVQVIVENGKRLGTAYLEVIATDRNEVIFTESIYYYDFVSRGLLCDMGDAVTTPLTEYNETVSIMDKLSVEQQNFYKSGDSVYAVPFRSNVQGITYDMDLFAEGEFYFAKGGAPSEYCEYTQNNNESPASGSFDGDPTNYMDYTFTDGTDANNMSAGPDGKYGTTDDGLPATYDEFFIMCDKMVDNETTPMIWTGQYATNYLNHFMDQLIADYEGLEQFNMYYSFDGTAKHLVDTDALNATGEVSYLPAQTITPGKEGNGYLMSQSAGRYYALQFFERLIKNKDYYDAKSFNQTESHLGAQSDFLYSKWESRNIAMLMEGIWWENEAETAFSELSVHDGSSKLERNFGLMYLPKATEAQIGETSTYADILNSLCMINGNIKEEKKELARQFVRFCFTEESNRAWNVDTGTPRAMEYTLLESDWAQISTFGKRIYNITQENPIGYTYANTTFYKENAKTVAVAATVGFNNPGGAGFANAFKNHADTATAIKIFVDSKDYLKDTGAWS